MIKKEKYRALCNAESSIPIFSKDWWLDSVCDDKWDAIVIERNGNIKAVMPYVVLKKPFIKALGMPLLTQFLGPYIKYEDNLSYQKKLSFENKIIFDILSFIPKVNSFSINCSYEMENWLPFFWNNFKQTTRYSYLIDDLNDLDQVFSNFSSSYRNKIRKSKRLLEVKKDLNIEEFYDLNTMVFNRQNLTPPYSKEFIIKHDEVLRQNKAREIFYASDEDGKIHSALYLTWDKKSSYLHMIGENPDLRKSSAGILLVWEAIQYTKNTLELNKFDFEGSMISSVEQVRRSFGAVQKPYFNIYKNESIYLKTKEYFKSLLK